MKQRILYIINPISGTQEKCDIVEQAKALTDSKHYEVSFAFTEFAGHATELAANAVKEGFHIVVAVGGDGTVNEVGRALVHTQTALGIIPCGSGNGLARHLRIPLHVPKAIQIINQGVIHELDYGLINNHPFFCTCGVGFDAFISEKFAEAGKRGILTYVENTLRLGLQYKPQTYVIEDAKGAEKYRALLIACANASQYGNEAQIAPFASMKDGLLDVVVLEPFSAIEAPQIALQLFTGTLPENSHVKTFKTSSLIIHREKEGVAHYDGEPFVTDSTVQISLQNRSLQVVVNPEKETMAAQSPVKNLLQLIPEFFNEWKATPEALLTKTSNDLKKLNKNIIEYLKRY